MTFNETPMFHDITSLFDWGVLNNKVNFAGYQRLGLLVPIDPANDEAVLEYFKNPSLQQSADRPPAESHIRQLDLTVEYNKRHFGNRVHQSPSLSVLSISPVLLPWYFPKFVAGAGGSMRESVLY